MRTASLVFLLVGLGMLSSSGRAEAQSRPTAPWAPSGSLAMGARFDLADDETLLGGMSSSGAFDLRMRSLAGNPFAYCVGFDGDLGGSSEGVVYNADAYLVGAGLRLGDSSYLAACGGAGLGGAAGAIPFAWQFPAELSAELQAGPVRLALWGKVTWTAGAEARSSGSSSLSLGDELSVGASLRLGRPESFWSTVNASHGYFLAAHYKELMGTRLIGLALGVGFWGGR